MKILLNEPCINGNEWKYIKECLDTNWVSSVGKYVDQFERVVAQYVSAKHAVACVNGTAALHIALLVAGIKPGEEVLVPALTFVAPANAARYIGAYPTFIDAEPATWQIAPGKITEFIQTKCRAQGGRLLNKKTKRRVTAILPVHILGYPVDMDEILEISKRYKLKVIEDATESLGSTYKHHHMGTMGDIGVFSFNGNKIITTGGGGMLVTNNKAMAEKARYLTTQAKDDPIEYVHKEIGYNYRLTNIQAAMGVAQMEQLNHFIERKRQIFRHYNEAFKRIAGIILPPSAPWTLTNCWLYTILVDAKKFGMTSRQLLKKLEAAGIQARPLWHPLHSLKIFKDCYAYQIEVVNRLYRDALSLPSSVGLKKNDQERIIAEIISNSNGLT